jgi:mRNA interferase MazF
MKQGEVWLTDFGVPSGPEQAGQRPAIVLQDNALNSALSTIIVVPLTTNLKRLTLPATLRLEAGEGGLPQESVVLGYQVQVRGKVRLTQKIGELSPERFAEVQDAVLTALGL